MRYKNSGVGGRSSWPHSWGLQGHLLSLSSFLSCPLLSCLPFLPSVLRSPLTRVFYMLVFKILLPQSFLSVPFCCCQSCLTLRPHELQHARLPCPSLSPAVCPDSCPLSLWCHPTITSSVVPFSSCLQSFPASGSFSMNQLFTSGGQSIGASDSASVLPMNIQY